MTTSVNNMAARREREQKNQDSRFLQWGILSHQQIQDLQQNQDQLHQELQQVLDLQNPQTCLREAVLLDLYVQGLRWASESGWTPIQTSFLMGVLQMLLDNIRETQMDLVDNLTELSKVLAPACPGVSSGVQSEDEALLDHEEADALMDYIRTSLIQNYTLYEVFFRTPREETLAGLERTIEVFGDALQPLVDGACTYLDPQEPPGTLGDPHGPLETLRDPQEPPGTLGDPHGPLETPRDPQESPVSPNDPQEPPGTSGDHQDPQ